MKEFRTDNLALCPYLQMHGLKYIRSELDIGKNDKPKVCFIFEDPKSQGRDLELDFMHSEIKKYRDLFFFFRNEIEKVNRRMQRLQLDEERAKSDKYYKD